MCVKFFTEDLKPSLCLTHFTSIYTCEVIIMPRMRSGVF